MVSPKHEWVNVLNTASDLKAKVIFFFLIVEILPLVNEIKEMWIGGLPPAKHEVQKTSVPLWFFLLLLFQKFLWGFQPSCQNQNKIVLP